MSVIVPVFQWIKYMVVFSHFKYHKIINIIYISYLYKFREVYLLNQTSYRDRIGTIRKRRKKIHKCQLSIGVPRMHRLGLRSSQILTYKNTEFFVNFLFAIVLHYCNEIGKYCHISSIFMFNNTKNPVNDILGICPVLPETQNSPLGDHRIKLPEKWKI